MGDVGYEICIDWSGDGDFVGVGEDVTARVLDKGTPITTRYGRDEARALAPLTPGRAQGELDNTSRDYMPDNTSSPLTGLVFPGREVRVRATHNAVTYGIFRGHLDDFEILPDFGDRSVRFTCQDPLARLRGVQVTTDLYHGIRTGAAIGYLLDAIGWPPDLRDLDVGGTTLPWWWVGGDDALSALQKILDCEGPGSIATVDIDGRIVFRDRHHRLLRAASTTVQATFRSGDLGSEPAMSPPFVYDHGLRDIINAVEFSIPVRAPSGELAQVWSMHTQQAITDGETVSLSAQASDPFFGAVTPVVGVDFTVLSGVVTTALTRTAGSSTTVLVTATGGPAVISGMSVRAYPIVTQTVAQVQAVNSASVDRYGRRSWQAEREPTLASLPDAIAIADIILAQRAERLPTITVTLNGLTDERLVEQLTRDLSDRVRIIETETSVDADFFLEQIQHVISDLHQRTTFSFEKIPTPAANPFTFDTTGQGFNDGFFGDTGRDNAATVFVFDDPTRGQFDVGLLGN
jgi:hypothetical protein